MRSGNKNADKPAHRAASPGLNSDGAAVPPRKPAMKIGCTLRASFLLVIAVLWNLAWYATTRAILSARFQGKAVPNPIVGKAEYRYLFPKNYGLATNAEEVLGRDQLYLERLWATVGYDPTCVLSSALHLFDKFERDVEVIAEIGDETFSMTFVPLGASTAFHHTPDAVYKIGKDCIVSGTNSFSFRHVSVDGGYGMGLEIHEIISEIAFGEDALVYDVRRSDYGLVFWLVPVARKNKDNSHVALGRMK